MYFLNVLNVEGVSLKMYCGCSTTRLSFPIKGFLFFAKFVILKMLLTSCSFLYFWCVLSFGAISVEINVEGVSLKMYCGCSTTRLSFMIKGFL